MDDPLGDSLADILGVIDSWGAEHAAAAVVRPMAGTVAGRGDPGHAFRWASVTKPLTAWAVMIAADRGLVALAEPAGPPGATVRHLLAHASGLPFEGSVAISAPGRRRIYSNPGFDVLGGLLAERSGMPVERVLRDWVLAPLGMDSTRLVDRPSQGLEGSLADLAAFAGELLRPTLVDAPLAREATRVAFPELAGVVPGVGNFDPCDWGLGVEIRGEKSPHWTGMENSTTTYGHFGGTGTFIWVDPVLDAALVCLSDRPFGSWALEAWPSFSDAVTAGVRA